MFARSCPLFSFSISPYAFSQPLILTLANSENI
jgi:hypothetical protein